MPTLVDGNLVITEARAVFDYITARSGKPRPNAHDWRIVAVEGQTLGFLEGVVSLIREHRREQNERSSFLISVERERIARCLPDLERLARERRVPDVSEFSGATLGSALELVSLHGFGRGWEVLHPHLSEWLVSQKLRPSMQGTQPMI